VVAEGIETDEQARRLRELGCDMGQGYAWAHPADPIKVGQFVARRLDGQREDQRRSPKIRSRNRNRLTKSR